MRLCDLPASAQCKTVSLQNKEWNSCDSLTYIGEGKRKREQPIPHSPQPASHPSSFQFSSEINKQNPNPLTPEGDRFFFSETIRERECRQRTELRTFIMVGGAGLISNGLGDLGNYYYGPGHPMKPQRLRLTHNLLLTYKLYRFLEVYVDRGAEDSFA